MQIQNSVAFVTGTNRGLGAALVRALQTRGASKIYAASRTGEAHHDGTQPVKLDITNADDVAAAAALANDTTLLINNAGINLYAAPISPADADHARQEMEVNYFGTLAMSRAFAPILAANSGGALVNLSSIMGRTAIPMAGSASASKAAVLILTHAIRAQLAKQGTHVVLVVPGAMDTDMAAGFPPPKADPLEVANFILDAVENGGEDIYPDAMSQAIMEGFATDRIAAEKQFFAYLP